MSLLDLILILILVAWLGGWGLHVGGDLIHVLLALLLVGIIVRVFTGRRIG